MNRSDAGYNEGKLLLDARGVGERVEALSRYVEGAWKTAGERLALVGIQTRGAHLARRVASALQKNAGLELPVGILDITLYRDDVHAIADQPEVKETELPFDLENRTIVLIDDVLFTGRTVRSAMNAIIDYGRPASIRLAVLIDRGHRELPVGADFVGLTIKTTPQDVVDVNLREIDEEDSVRLRQLLEA